MYTDAENQVIELIHAERDKILSETSSWEESGTDEQLAYRQAIADIEDQSEYPYSVTWPTKPEQDRQHNMESIWNIGLTAGFGFLIWWIKAHHEELKRVTILLNRTREELAKEYVTKADSSQVLGQIMSKFDRIEEKLDRLVERK